MQFFLDHIIAAVIGITIVILLARTQIDTQSANADALRFYSNRVQTLAFVELMQRDFQNIGTGVAAGDEMILSLSSDSPTTAFEFMATPDTTATASLQRIRYDLVQAGTVQVKIGGVVQVKPRYEVRRMLYSGTGFILTGKSSAGVLEFKVNVYNAAGIDAGTNYRQARSVAVSLAMVSSAGQDGITGEARWQSQFRPLSLSLQ